MKKGANNRCRGSASGRKVVVVVVIVVVGCGCGRVFFLSRHPFSSGNY